MKIFLIILICIIFAWTTYSLFFRKKKTSISRVCSVCGAEPKYGYSEHAEDIRKLTSMCRKCLMAQLEKDYAIFSGRAVVIQPVPGPPCYIFHSNEEWSKSFKESKMDDDARAYLLRMDLICRDCGQKAHFLWIESKWSHSAEFWECFSERFFRYTLAKKSKTHLSVRKMLCQKYRKRNGRERYNLS